MIFRKKALHFECTACGACCSGGIDHYIAVRRADLPAICTYLGIGIRWLRRRYIKPFSASLLSIRTDKNNRCVFLDKDNTCRIYPVRPTQCRTYPYWPELLVNRAAWRAEAIRCEGIDRGKQVPVSRIMKALRQQQAFEEETACDD